MSIEDNEAAEVESIGAYQNMVDILGSLADDIVDSVNSVARAITVPGRDAGMAVDRSPVKSLTEAVIGIEYGLHDVAESIRELAEAVRESA